MSRYDLDAAQATLAAFEPNLIEATDQSRLDPWAAADTGPDGAAIDAHLSLRLRAAAHLDDLLAVGRLVGAAMAGVHEELSTNPPTGHAGSPPGWPSGWPS